MGAINENPTVPSCKVLGMCYTLQLTERFKDGAFEIHIASDNKNSSTHYYLLVNKKTVIGYKEDETMDIQALPETLYSQRIYEMDNLQ